MFVSSCGFKYHIKKSKYKHSNDQITMKSNIPSFRWYTLMNIEQDDVYIYLNSFICLLIGSWYNYWMAFGNTFWRVCTIIRQGWLWFVDNIAYDTRRSNRNRYQETTWQRKDKAAYWCITIARQLAELCSCKYSCYIFLCAKQHNNLKLHLFSTTQTL